MSQGKMYVRGNQISGEVNYSYVNVGGNPQVMTFQISGWIDPTTKQINGTLSGLAVMNPIWGSKKKGRVTGTFIGAVVGDTLRGTWDATSDVSFLFQSDHLGWWQTR